MGLAAAAVVERREARAAEAAAKRARVEAAVARLQVSAGLATVRAKKQKKRLSSVASRVPARSVHQPQPVGQLVSKVTERCERLQDKRRWRRSSQIKSLLPKGSSQLSAFPRREEERFGEEGAAGDSLFEEAMAAFKASQFGDSHCEMRVIRQKLGQVMLHMYVRDREQYEQAV